MELKTLGRLQLHAPSRATQPGQPQALLLLTYLALEGPTERGHLAELFWPHGQKPRNNLSSALTRLRAIDPALVHARGRLVSTTVGIDANRFFERARAGHDCEALSLYRGRFLNGSCFMRLHRELEEWILDWREALAAAARDIAVRRAVTEHDRGNVTYAVRLAECAVRVGTDAIPEPKHYPDLVRILTARRSRLHRRVNREAQEFSALELSSDR